jgi:hypothetical protein
MTAPSSQRSSFETLIEDLFDRTGRADDAPRPSHQFSIDSLEAAWELAAHARGSPLPGDNGKSPPRFSLYGDERAEVAHDVPLDLNRIMGEVGLHQQATEAEAAALRRKFALRNHPDRVPSELRDLATQRMMIVNDLIDRHVARLRKAAG